MDVDQAVCEIDDKSRQIQDHSHKKPMTKAEEYKFQTILDKLWKLEDEMKKRRLGIKEEMR